MRGGLRRLVLVGAALLGAAVLVALLPLAAALGMFEPRTYLVLGQNTAELKAQGGFIGVYAEVVLERGRIASLTDGDALDLRYTYEDRLAAGEIPEPPEVEPSIHDASESPDFPTAAAAIAEAYWQITDVWPDGVIALDTTAVAGLVDLVGPLTVEGERTAVGRANLLALILRHTQRFDDPSADRKQFVYDLGRVLGQRLRALPPTRWPAVVGVLTRAADQRHVQIALDDPLLQALVRWRGWDGAFPPPAADRDFLAVVEANTGNKANLATEQTLTYRVTLEADGTANATLTIAYHNRGTGDLGFSTVAMPYLHNAAYDAQVRAYVPLGSRPLEGDSWELIEPDLGRTVFETWLTVPPEARHSAVLSYRLPSRVLDDGRIRYALAVRKQAGTGAVPLALEVVAPDGWRLRESAERVWRVETMLDVDRIFQVEFVPGASPSAAR